MKTYLLAFALLLLSVLAKKDNNRQIGATCTIDEQCASECCSNNRDFSHDGTCTHIDDDDRCHSRKKAYRVFLVIYLAVFAIAIIACSFLKQKQNKLEA